MGDPFETWFGLLATGELLRKVNHTLQSGKAAKHLLRVHFVAFDGLGECNKVPVSAV
jgi:hypothetical protein